MASSQVKGINLFSRRRTDCFRGLLLSPSAYDYAHPSEAETRRHSPPLRERPLHRSSNQTPRSLHRPGTQVNLRRRRVHHRFADQRRDHVYRRSHAGNRQSRALGLHPHFKLRREDQIRRHAAGRGQPHPRYSQPSRAHHRRHSRHRQNHEARGRPCAKTASCEPAHLRPAR